MLKPLKWVLITVAFLIATTLLLLAYVTTSIDPNDYRDTLQTTVKEKTGLSLTLEQIDWSLFPWLGLAIGKTDLKGVDGSDLASVNHIKVKVKLLPLLKKEVQIGEIKIDAATLHVTLNQQGELNWSTLGDNVPTDPNTQPTEESPNEPSPEFSLSVDEINIVNATLLYTDHSAAPPATPLRYTVEHLNLNIKNMALNSQTLSTQFPLTLSARFSDNQGVTLTPKLEAQVSAEIHEQIFELNQLTLTLHAELPDLPNPVSSTLHADIHAALKEDRLTIKQLVLNLQEQLTVTGQLTAQQISTEPSIKGQLSLAEADLTQLLKDLPIELPETQSPNALKRMAFDTAFTGNRTQLSLNPLKITLDQSTLTGHVAITDFEKQAINAKLHLDQLNIDDYLPPASEADTQPANNRGSDNDKGGDNGTDDTTAELLPIETLKTLNLNTDIAIDQLQANGIISRNMNMTLTAKDGLVQLKEIKGNTLEGQFTASAEIDVRSEEPKLRITKRLDQLQVEPALQALADSTLFAGLIFFNGDLSTRGNSLDAWTRNLTGESEFKLDQGLMRGLNLTEMAFEKIGALGPIAQSFLTEETKQKAPPAFRKESEIKALLAHVVFEDGKAKADQLDLSMGGATAKGSASFDLIEHNLAFNLNLTLSESLSNKYLSNIAWPIECQGNLSATPRCKIDSKPVKRAIEKLAKKQAEQRAKEAIAKKLKERTGVDIGNPSIEKAVKDEAKEQIKSKETELKETLQDTLEQELNERLKKLF